MEHSEFIGEIEKICLQNAESIFIEDITMNKQIRYLEFWEVINNYKNTVLKKLCRQDIVLVPLKNDIESVFLLFSAFLAGVKPVLVKKEAFHREFKKNSAYMLTSNIISFENNALTIKKSKTYSSTIPSQVAYLVFTSGSTGVPKAIQISYENLIVETRSMLRAYKLEKHDTHLCILPINHASGLYRNVLMAFFSGAKTVLVNNFNVKKFWDFIDKFSINFVQINPTIISSLLREYDAENYIKPKSIKFIGSASAPHSEHLVREFESKFKIPLLVGYGMTEATCGITLNNGSFCQNGSVGKPIDIYEINMFDEEDRLIREPFQQGEVVVKGPGIMAGYLTTDDSEIDYIRHDYNILYTGDLGYKDDDGFIYIAGRKDDIIKRGGYRLNISEIEKEIYFLDFINECVILAVPNQWLGSDIIGFVVLKENSKINSRGIISKLKSILPPEKIPSEFLIIDKIPKNNSNKVNKDELINLYNMKKQKRV